MIVTLSTNIAPGTLLKMITADCIDRDDALPRSLAEFRLACVEAVRRRFLLGWDTIEHPREDGATALKLLERSARKGGWLT